MECLNEQHQIIMAPQAAMLFVPYTSALIRSGPNGGQVIDMDGVIWGCLGTSPSVAFARYRMGRAATVDAGQVAGRI